ncbi:MAG: hypothetical protein AAF490_24065 [Chloroflexota bacterium]
MVIKLESTLVGVAGEYLVAGELTLRGFIASITLRNSRGVDIIVTNAEATKSVSIQVKTNSNGQKLWMVNKKAESYFSDTNFYIFVTLQSLNERPAYHIVPSQFVATHVTENHAKWLLGIKKDGSPRKDTSMRKFSDDKGKYLEAWHLLRLSHAE